MIEIIFPDDGAVDDVRRFMCEVNADNPRWVPPPDPSATMSPVWFVLRDEDRSVQAVACGIVNDALRWNGETPALLGWYESRQSADTGELFNAASAHFARAGHSRIIGPMNGSTWHRYRISLASSPEPPFLLDVDSRPWHQAQWERAGFVPVARYLSTAHSVHSASFDRLAELDSRLRLRGVHIRTLRREHFIEELHALHAIAIEAFADNVLASPIDFDAFADIYRPFESMIDPDLVLIADSAEGRPIGFVFALEDRSTSPHLRLVIKTAAVLAGFRASGLGHVLPEMIHREAVRRGAREVIHALMHVDNRSTRIIAETARVIRRYVLYARESG